MKRNRDGTVGQPTSRNSSGTSPQSHPAPTSSDNGGGEGKPSLTGGANSSWSKPSMLRRGRNSNDNKNSTKGREDPTRRTGSTRPGGAGHRGGDTGLFNSEDNSSSSFLSEEQKLYIAADKWCTPMAVGILSRTDLGTMRAGEIISLLQEVAKVLPYWKGNTEQQLIVMSLLTTIPWQRLQSSAAAAEEEERTTKLDATPTLVGSPGDGRKTPGGKSGGRKPEGVICKNVEEPFITISNVLVGQRPTFINSIIDIILKPFSQVQSEEATLKRQKTLAVKMLHNFMCEYPTRKDLLVDCIVKQGLTSCYPLRYCPSYIFHLEYQDMCMLLMFEPEMDQKMEEIHQQWVLSNQGKSGAAAVIAEKQAVGGVTAVGGRNSAVLFGGGGGGGGRFSGGGRAGGGGNQPALPPNVVWQQVKEAIFNMLVNKLSEMEASYKETNDISHYQFSSNLIYSSQSLAAVLQEMAKAHFEATERGENPAELWWPSILSNTYKERLVQLKGKTVVTHMLVPCILSFVSSQAVLDLLHAITTMVLKESSMMTYSARETIASHLYSLHYLVRHVPDIHDWGLIRRIGKWIEAAVTAEESKRSEHSVMTIPAVPSLPSTVTGTGVAKKKPVTKAPATSAAACALHRLANMTSSQLNTKVELELAALENVPPSLVNMVYQQHVGLCDLYGLSKEKDISTEHVDVLDRRVKASKTQPLPYDATLFAVYEPAKDDIESQATYSSRAMSQEPEGGMMMIAKESTSSVMPAETPLVFDLGTPSFARLSQGGSAAQLKHEMSVLSALARPPLVMSGHPASNTGSGVPTPHETPTIANMHKQQASFAIAQQQQQRLNDQAKATPVAEGLQSTSKLPSLSPITGGPMPPAFKQSDFMKQQIVAREAQESQLLRSGSNSQSKSPLAPGLHQQSPTSVKITPRPKSTDPTGTASSTGSDDDETIPTSSASSESSSGSSSDSSAGSSSTTSSGRSSGASSSSSSSSNSSESDESSSEDDESEVEGDAQPPPAAASVVGSHDAFDSDSSSSGSEGDSDGSSNASSSDDTESLEVSPVKSASVVSDDESVEFDAVPLPASATSGGHHLPLEDDSSDSGSSSVCSRSSSGSSSTSQVA